MATRQPWRPHRHGNVNHVRAHPKREHSVTKLRGVGIRQRQAGNLGTLLLCQLHTERNTGTASCSADTHRAAGNLGVSVQWFQQRHQRRSVSLDGARDTHGWTHRICRKAFF